MPYFCQCGADEYICHVCGTIKCSKDDAPQTIVLRIDKDKRPVRGNACPKCYDKSVVTNYRAVEQERNSLILAEAKTATYTIDQLLARIDRSRFTKFLDAYIEREPLDGGPQDRDRVELFLALK